MLLVIPVVRKLSYDKDQNPHEVIEPASDTY